MDPVFLFSLALFAALAEIFSGLFVFLGLSAALLSMGILTLAGMDADVLASPPVLIITTAGLWLAFTILLRWTLRRVGAGSTPPDPNDLPE